METVETIEEGEAPFIVPTSPHTSYRSWLARRRPFQTKLEASVLGWLFAAAGLWWVLRDLDFGQLALHLSRINVWLLALAVICDVLTYVSQG